MKILLLLFLEAITLGTLSAQTKLAIYTFSSAGGVTGTTSPPNFFSSIGQPAVSPRKTFLDYGAGVMVGANFMFAGGGGDNTPPTITFASSPGPVVKLGVPNTITVTMQDETSLSLGRMYYRPILGGNFTQVDLTGTGTPNVFSGFALADSMGVEFYFKAFDSQNAARDPASGSYYAYTKYTTPDLPLHKGPDLKDYRIIAEPFVSGNITALFGGLPNPDSTKMRFWKYESGAWTEFNDFTTIERGKGYFLIMSATTTNSNNNLKMGDQNAPPNNRSSLFSMPLISNDWNLIGNPYPIEINWDSVMLLNSNPSTVSSQLKIYRGNNTSYTNSSVLGAFQGAWVKVTGAAPANFKIGLGTQNKIGGRIGKNIISSNLAASSWEIPLIMKQGESENVLAGIGMRPDASDGIDRFDDFNPPSVGNYVELLSQRPDLKVNDLTRDVVNTQEKYIWKFESVTNAKENISMNWDNKSFGSNSVPLFLYDLDRNEVIDMRDKTSHSFSPAESRHFKIYFGYERSDISPDVLLLNSPYPNPFGDQAATEFRLGLPGMNDTYQVQLDLFNAMGQRVKTLVHGEYPSGRHSITWNGTGDDNEKVAAGMYIYRLVVDGKESRIWDGRIIYSR